MALMKAYKLMAVAGAVLTLLPSLALAQAQLYNSPPATGGQTAPQTCDPDYWQSMSAKAWMEAEREIIQNKNLIYKPDSVMEYVCFDSFMQHAGKHLGNVFTHTTYFDNKMIIPRGTSISLENALTTAVTNSYKTYQHSNFGDMFLGERSEEMPMIKDRTIGDASRMAEYACSVMREVWMGAKCENFIDKKAFEGDGFHPFETLKPGPGGNKEIKGYNQISDPRKYPTACLGPDNADWNWKKSIPEAKNVNDKLYDAKVPVKQTYDEIRPRLEPGSCSTSIFTGVTVITETGGLGYADVVCSNPGCTFVKGKGCQP